jgi:hypothetical protein
MVMAVPPAIPKMVSTESGAEDREPSAPRQRFRIRNARVRARSEPCMGSR